MVPPDMLIYEFGVYAAMALWACTTAGALVVINSPLDRNLNRIGLRLGWATLTPKPLRQSESKHSTIRKLLKFVVLSGAGLALTLGSWLYVLYVIALIVYRKRRNARVPTAVRELMWRMQNVDLTADKLRHQLEEVRGFKLGVYEGVRDKVASMHDTSEGLTR